MEPHFLRNHPFVARYLLDPGFVLLQMRFDKFVEINHAAALRLLTPVRGAVKMVAGFSGLSVG